jgi:hypothetical protein
MKTKAEQIWLAFVTAIFLNASLLDCSAQPGSPPILTLPNGAQLLFAGTTYGTINTPPSPENYIGHHNIQFNEGETFETPQLFVWFQWKETNAPPVRTMPPLFAKLADQKGVERGAVSHPAFWDGVLLSYAAFPVIPRRSQMLQLNFYREEAIFASSLKPVASISITNPLYGHFPEWKPEALPQVRTAGDLEVRLENLEVQPQITSTGVQQGKRSVTRGSNLETFFDVSLKSARGTNEAWMVQRSELSDATGNVIRNMNFAPVNLLTENSKMRTFYLPSDAQTLWATLWPDEAAWKLKLELKRYAGFATNELVTFQNVPLLRYSEIAGGASTPSTRSYYSLVGPTNEIWMTNTVGSFQVILEEHMRWDSGAIKYFSYPKFFLKIPNAPHGWDVEIVQMTTPSGEPVHVGSGNDFITNIATGVLKLEPFRLAFAPTNATTVNIICAVQKTRSVEFLVAPPLPR